MNKLVSIIVPVYNVEKYLKRCMTSILEQTYSNLEILLIDDGSPDNSGNLCDEIQSTDERIKVYHKANGGLSSARNYGLERCTGEYIFFIDSDDWIEKNAIELLVSRAEETGADLVCGSYKEAREDGNVIRNVTQERKTFNPEEAMYAYLNGTAIHSIVWGKLYRNTMFSGIRFPEGCLHEDEFVTYQLIYAANQIETLPEVLYDYVIRENSITSKKFSKARLVTIDAARGLYEETLRHDAKEIQELGYRKYIKTLESMYVCAQKYLDDEQIGGLEHYQKEIHTECKKACKKLQGKSELRRQAFLIAYFPLYFTTMRKVRQIAKRLAGKR